MTKKILLIEDMKGVRDSLEMLLSSAGYDVQCAATGREGLDKAKSSRFDLIISDILMPDLDGTEVIIAIQASPSPPPILAISGGGQGTTADQALTLAQQKANAVLAKPFSKHDLLSKVSELIG